LLAEYLLDDGMMIPGSNGFDFGWVLPNKGVQTFWIVFAQFMIVYTQRFEFWDITNNCTLSPTKHQILTHIPIHLKLL
jgi:hypothetical protein